MSGKFVSLLQNATDNFLMINFKAIKHDIRADKTTRDLT